MEVKWHELHGDKIGIYKLKEWAFYIDLKISSARCNLKYMVLKLACELYISLEQKMSKKIANDGKSTIVM